MQLGLLKLIPTTIHLHSPFISTITLFYSAILKIVIISQQISLHNHFLSGLTSFQSLLFNANKVKFDYLYRYNNLSNLDDRILEYGCVLLNLLYFFQVIGSFLATCWFRTAALLFYEGCHLQSLLIFVLRWSKLFSNVHFQHEVHRLNFLSFHALILIFWAQIKLYSCSILQCQIQIQRCQSLNHLLLVSKTWYLLLASYYFIASLLLNHLNS